MNVSTFVTKLNSPRLRETRLSLLDQALMSGLNFLISVTIERTTGTAGLGVYTLVFTLVVWAIAAQDALIASPYTVFGVRLPHDERKTALGSALVQHFVLGILFVVGLTTAASLLQWLDKSVELVPSLWVLGFLVPFVMLRELGRRLAYAHLDVAQAMHVDLVYAWFLMGGLGTLAWCGALTPAMGVAALGGASCIAGLYWLVRHRKSFEIHWAKAWEDSRRNASFGAWGFASRWLGLAQLYLLYWILGIALSKRETGVLSACMNVVMISNPIVIGFSNLAISWTANAFADGGVDQMERTVRRTSWSLVGVIGLFAIGVILLGDLAMQWMYSHIGSGHTWILAGLVLTVVLETGALAIDSGLRTLEHPNLPFVANFISVAVTLISAYWFVAIGGVTGAAWSIFLGRAVGTAFMVWAFRIAVKEHRSSVNG